MRRGAIFEMAQGMWEIMAFSDDDLKRLKDHVAMSSGSIVGIPLLPEEIAALLSRLEAAEKVIDEWLHPPDESEIQEAYEAWRNAAGR